jgi:sugar/nucleoside kinase (ribokinase family)
MMMKEQSVVYDIVIIGNYTKDTIISPAGKSQVDGGGFNYGVHVAAMMGLKVAAVTRLAKDDAYVLDVLIALGTDVFPYYTPQSTNMCLYYPTTDVDNRILSVTSVAEPFLPSQIDSLEAKVFLLNASTRGEIPLAVLNQIRKKDTLIAADLQGFVRVIADDGNLVYAPWPEQTRFLSKIDVLKCDAVEATFLTSEDDISSAARMLSELGPREIVLTHRGGLLVYADGVFYEAPFKPKKLEGRSGRGDTCIAAYMGRRLNGSSAEATIWAAAVTSLKMEAEGPILRREEEVKHLINNEYIEVTKRYNE